MFQRIMTGQLDAPVNLGYRREAVTEPTCLLTFFNKGRQDLERGNDAVTRMRIF